MFLNSDTWLKKDNKCFNTATHTNTTINISLHSYIMIVIQARHLDWLLNMAKTSW